MFEFLWDLHQSFQIADQRSRVAALQEQATRGQHAARRAAADVEALERRIDALTLTVMATWSILEERLNVTEAELADRVREIDLRDGRLDGRAAPPPLRCTGCGRQVSARHRACIYCGRENLGRGPLP